MAATIKHIAIVRLSALGDVAMTVPVINALCVQYPNLKVTVVSKPFVKPLFAHLPQVNFVEAHVYKRHKGIFGLRKLAKELNESGIDAMADLHNVIRTKILRSFVRMGGVRVSVVDKGRAQKKALTRPKNKVFEPLKRTQERYAEVFAALGLPLKESSFLAIDKQPLVGSPLKLLGDWKGKLVGIAPFAAYEAKTYPLDLMTSLVSHLSEQQTCKIFLFGGGSEEVAKLHTMAKGLINVQVAAGKLTFTEELALISNLDLMIAMDSANGHLAANYNIPVITLWGATHPYLGFTPFNQPMELQLLPDLEKYPMVPTSVYGNKLPESYQGLMRSILVEKILETIKKVI